MSEHRPMRFLLPLAFVAVAAASPSTAQDESGPCSLVSIDQVAEVTGVRVTQTFPSGNLSAGAQCTYGGGDRPPTLIVSMARNARDSYESNRLFPNATPVDGVGIKATWVPMPSKLAVLGKGDLYVLVTMSDPGAGGPAAVKARAIALARLALKKLGA